MKKPIDTYNWESKIFGGLNKYQIRELSKGGVFFGNIFATIETPAFLENGVITLEINLDNVPVDKLKNQMGHDYAKKLSLNSDTHSFEFIKFKVTVVREDISGYEPTKMRHPTMVNTRYVVAILKGVKL